ncbi:glycyl-tRNA synthetase [Theileria annulata]|uniref:glycine--tRNA ligase n=1 Tax=Theileria annulata TaxID=5874 RepID=Q4UH14_THEAN|nr:glycyl-tRNA synthetase [Theileria annulata]CAI73625.1 glycyl-trna synthetase, putative [Theileria annulata]|eukprot:XP_954302.1 glycyl-trna synthetase, putative [Theileria annulata]
MFYLFSAPSKKSLFGLSHFDSILRGKVFNTRTKKLFTNTKPLSYSSAFLLNKPQTSYLHYSTLKSSTLTSNLNTDYTPNQSYKLQQTDTIERSGYTEETDPTKQSHTLNNCDFGVECNKNMDLVKENLAESNFKREFKSLKMSTEKLRDQLVLNKVDCENLLRRRFFYTNSFEIYGGSAGLFDFGPPGCALKSELERLWREHFVVFDEMLEVSCTCITPHPVLKSSGHVDRFTDLMVKNLSNGDCYRADKYLEDLISNIIQNKSQSNLNNSNDVGITNKNLKTKLNSKLEKMTLEELMRLRERVGTYNQDEMERFYMENEVRSPEGDEFSKPFPFNLMFSTSIGPKTEDKLSSLAYLRPETAQGIFVNFNRLLEFNGGKIPFAAAQIGLGFRNEISPRNGLLRVREFPMAEIEYFVNPKFKTHEKFPEFKNTVLPLLTRDQQTNDNFEPIHISMSEAVSSGIVGNEALAYFLARTFLFLKRVGINEAGLRFRQHMANEMAHYASDCWDAEILTSYGWVEVVGHADRMAYDLMCHSKSTNSQLVAHHRYDNPIQVEKVLVKCNKPEIGKAFKSDQKILLNHLNNLTLQQSKELHERLENNTDGCVVSVDGKEFLLKKSMVSFEYVNVNVCDETFVPCVIEPSFGLGRLIFSILEHSYRVRPVDVNVPEERKYVALNKSIAPTKCSVLPLSSKEVFEPLITRVQAHLRRLGISHKVDKTGASIGKRYARTDEIGIPFCVTLDFQSVNDDTVTLRERDTMQQVRIKLDDLGELINNLLKDDITWEQATKHLPIFTQQLL